jgi:L-ribulokinase
MHPEYLAKCGGVYSSEWFFSKVLHCLRVDPAVFKAAYSWVELADFIPGILSGESKPENLKRSVCAAGHKAMYNKNWGGLPAKDFLNNLATELGTLRDRLYTEAYTSDTTAGFLSEENAKDSGLKAGIPVSVGAFDAHMGAVGAGIGPGTLVKIIGTSTCDMMVVPDREKLPDIPGLCGMVDGSILPNYFGLEAGQSAVGDIFNWFVENLTTFTDSNKAQDMHRSLTEKAGSLKPGESGLLALDWNNGNRTVLVDARLTGLIVGQTLNTKPEEIYRALIEATGYGARIIINRFEEYGIKVEEVIACGGIAEKNPLLMQIYADIFERPIKVSRSSQTCALGAAMFGAVVGGKERGGYRSVEEAIERMSGVKPTVYYPDKKKSLIYSKLFRLYQQLHDIFGTHQYSSNLYNVMKELLQIKQEMKTHA